MRQSLIALICMLSVCPLLAADSVNADDLAQYIIEKAPGKTQTSQTGFFTFCPWGKGTEPAFEVLTADGSNAVPHQVLWAADGEPITVLFDCSRGYKTYIVRELAKPKTPKRAWRPTGGLVLETRAFKDGDISSWRGIRRTCSKAYAVLGRSLVPNIFLGINPQGPTEHFISVFRGYLNIEKAGKYTFAVNSDGACSFFVDGGHVVSWPGYHHARGAGRRGRIKGEIYLKKGPHSFEYLNVQKGSAYTVVLAWKKPGDKELSIVPASAFVPANEYRVVRSEAAGARGSIPVRFSWRINRHVCAWGKYLVSVDLKALSDGDSYVWLLDDGTVCRGKEVRHLFLSPGMRNIKLVVRDGRRKYEGENRIMVHRDWGQLGRTEQSYWDKVRGFLEKSDFSGATPEDLLNVLDMTSMADDHKLAKKVADVCMTRLEELGARAAEIAMRAGLYYKSVEVRDYAMAQKAFESAIRLSGTDGRLKGKAQLALVDSILPVSDDYERVRKVMDSIDDANLDSAQRRIRKIYEGDLMLAMGNIESARKKYAEAGEGAGASNVHDERKRVAMIEIARDYNRRGELNAAERIISGIQYKVPMERLNRDVGLMLLDTCLGRTDYTRAYYLSKRLLQNSEFDSNRPALLYKLAESAYGLKADAEAKAVVEKLIKEFPYSESAALARERWMGKDVKSR